MVSEYLAGQVLRTVMKNIRWVILITLLCASFAMAQIKIPELKQRVTDLSNTLSSGELQELEDKLRGYEAATSTQIVVLMVNSLEGESIEEYANRTFSANKIGQAKDNNGVMLVVAKQDKKMRIEVGYGLEGVLTDALSSQIIRNEIRPYFKEEKYFNGILSGIDAIMLSTKGEYSAHNKANKAPGVSVGLVFMIIFFGIFVLLPMMTSRRRSIIGSGGGNYFSGWGYGGGGSFGGFGGGGGGFSGGGGMSGGGGASGSW
jgi:uncharacterized protein